MLPKVALKLRKGFAGDNLFAWYGGEELVALMPSTTIEGVRAHTNLEQVAAPSIPHERSPDSVVTLSLAVGLTVEEGDGTLYAAKRAGWNRAAKDC